MPHSAEQPTSGKPRKEQTIVPTTDQIKKQPATIGQQDTPDTREALTSEVVLDTTPTHGDVHPTSSIKPDSRPLSVQGEEPTSATQEPPRRVKDSLDTEDISTDALGNVQSKPSTPDVLGATPGSTPADEVVAEQISSPSGNYNHIVHYLQACTYKTNYLYQLFRSRFSSSCRTSPLSWSKEQRD